MAETETEAKTKPKKTQEKLSPKEGMVNYFKGVKSEWGKITWPEKNQVVMETIIVVIVVTAFTTIVYLLDILFKYLLGLIK